MYLIGYPILEYGYSEPLICLLVLEAIHKFH